MNPRILKRDWLVPSLVVLIPTFLFTIWTVLPPYLRFDGDLNTYYLRYLDAIFAADWRNWPIFSVFHFAGHPLVSDPASAHSYYPTHFLALLSGFRPASYGFMSLVSALIITSGGVLLFVCLKRWGLHQGAALCGALIWMLGPLSMRPAQQFWGIYLLPLLPGSLLVFNEYRRKPTIAGAGLLMLMTLLLFQLPHPQYLYYLLITYFPFLFFASIADSNKTPRDLLIRLGPGILGVVISLPGLREHLQFAHQTMRSELGLIGAGIKDLEMYRYRFAVASDGSLYQNFPVSLLFPPGIVPLVTVLGTLFSVFFVRKHVVKKELLAFAWIGFGVFLLWFGKIGPVYFVKWAFNYLPYFLEFRLNSRWVLIFLFFGAISFAWLLQGLAENPNLLKRWRWFVGICGGCLLIALACRVWELGWWLEPERYTAQFRVMAQELRWLYVPIIQFLVILGWIVWAIMLAPFVCGRSLKTGLSFAVLIVLLLAQGYGIGFQFAGRSQWGERPERISAEASPYLLHTYNRKIRPKYRLRAEIDPIIGCPFGVNVWEERPENRFFRSLIYGYGPSVEFQWNAFNNQLGLLLNSENVDAGFLPRAYLAPYYCSRTLDDTWKQWAATNYAQHIDTVWGEDVVADVSCGISKLTEGNKIKLDQVQKQLLSVAQNVKWLRAGNNHVLLKVDALDSSRVLQLNLPFDPRWEATSDGKPIRIVRTFGRFMGVVLPKGKHVVDFRFCSRSLLIYWLGFALITGTFGAFSLRRRESKKLSAALLLFVSAHSLFIFTGFAMSSAIGSGEVIRDEPPEPYVQLDHTVVTPDQMLVGMDALFSFDRLAELGNQTGARTKRLKNHFVIEAKKGLLIPFIPSNQPRSLYAFSHFGEAIGDCEISISGSDKKMHWSGCGAPMQTWVEIMSVPAGSSYVSFMPLDPKNPRLGFARLAIGPSGGVK